jgi:hypothetical protein
MLSFYMLFFSLKKKENNQLIGLFFIFGIMNYYLDSLSEPSEDSFDDFLQWKAKKYQYKLKRHDSFEEFLKWRKNKDTYFLKLSQSQNNEEHHDEDHHDEDKHDEDHHDEDHHDEEKHGEEANQDSFDDSFERFLHWKKNRKTNLTNTNSSNPVDYLELVDL